MYKQWTNKTLVSRSWTVTHTYRPLGWKRATISNKTHILSENLYMTTTHVLGPDFGLYVRREKSLIGEGLARQDSMFRPLWGLRRTILNRWTVNRGAQASVSCTEKYLSVPRALQEKTKRKKQKFQVPCKNWLSVQMRKSFPNYLSCLLACLLGNWTWVCHPFAILGEWYCWGDMKHTPPTLPSCSTSRC